MRKIYLFDMGLLVLAGATAAVLTGKPVHPGTSSGEEIAGEVYACPDMLELIETGCETTRNVPSTDDPGPDRDEFAESGVTGPADIEEIFSERFFFGCEADDPLNGLAFAKDLNPTGSQLRAMFASDIGHWDVPDVREVLPEAWELVENGVLDEEHFRAFSCDNVIGLLTQANPGFFDGTVIDVETAK